jgi:hypothetical protein
MVYKGTHELQSGLIMKANHIAGLALVAWYLMVPPPVNAPYKIDTEAPITSWKVYRTFNSADECKQSLSAAKSKYNQTATAPIGTIKRGSRAFALQMVFGQCVKSDDPGLAK